MRELFRLFTIFDWVTPFVSWIDDLRHDPTFMMQNSWSFIIPYDEAIAAGWDAASIDRLLRKHGIGSYGRLYAPYAVSLPNGYEGERYAFSVPLRQAKWAEYVLMRHGVPIMANSEGAPGEGKTL